MALTPQVRDRAHALIGYSLEELAEMIIDLEGELEESKDAIGELQRDLRDAQQSI